MSQNQSTFEVIVGHPRISHNGIVYYSETEIKPLLEERKLLLEEKKLWLAEKDRLNNTISGWTEMVKTLKRANGRQAKRISDLEKENQDLRAQVQTLKDEVTALKLKHGNEIKLLNDRIKALEDRDAKRQSDHDIKLIIVALQEINDSDELEGKYPYMKYIREERHGIAHYIRTRDSVNLVAYKRKLIFDQLNRARDNPDIVAALAFYDPALIDDMIAHFAPSSNTDGASLKPMERSSAEYWWTR